MKKILVLDVESTTKAKGHPFHRDNKLCLVGLYDGNTYYEYDIEYTDSPYGASLLEIKRLIESCDILVGFNIKFDLHWIRRYIHDIRFPAIHDCQLTAFILGNQQSPYPSLDKICTLYGLVGKSDSIVHQLWAEGFDTPAIDKSILSEYLKGDVTKTYAVYLKQLEEIKPFQQSLIKLHNQDLLVLEEMEFNGMPFNQEECNKLNDEYSKELESVNDLLKHYYPRPDFNPGSNHQLSVLLFGGSLEYDCQVPTFRTLKSGEVKIGSKRGTAYQQVKGFFKPKKEWEFKATAKLQDYDLVLSNKRRQADGKKLLQRIYSTDAETLQSLKSQAKSAEAKALIDLLTRQAYLEKLQSTYTAGYLKLVEQYGWDDKRLHGQFNQCVAITGRLSSSNPNLQNIAKEIKPIFRSIYGNN